MANNQNPVSQTNPTIADETKPVYGLRSIQEALEPIVHYPVTRHRLRERIGKAEIFWTRDESFMMDDILTEIHQNMFHSEDELRDAILETIHLAYGDRQVENSEGLFT